MRQSTADSDSTWIAVDNGDTAIDSEWKADAAHAKVSYHSNGQGNTAVALPLSAGKLTHCIYHDIYI
jgi:hypothetical protein